MAIPLNGVRVIGGPGLVVVGTTAIAVIEPGEPMPVQVELLRAILDLTEAEDPVASLDRCPTGTTAVALWTVTDGEPLIAVRGSLNPLGDGQWVEETTPSRIWRPTRGAFHALGVIDESRAVPASLGVWPAAGIAVGTRAASGPANWWETAPNEDGERIPDLEGEMVDDDRLPTVEGVLCPNGHIVNPVALFCHVDGLSLENISRLLISGPRHPFAGLLVDGRQHVLVRDAVVGRAPETHDLVTGGKAIGVVVPDDTGVISRAHLHIELEGWKVRVRDLDSALGTFVLLEGADDWVRLPPEARYEIPTTARFRIGDVEAYLARSDIR